MCRTMIFLAGIGLMASACSVYVPSGQTASRSTATHESVASVSFTSVHASLVREYYAASSPGNSRGRGRRGGLPPGIEKNLQQGKPLPPGLAMQYLPQDLLVRLPRAPSGLEYVVVAGKLLLVEIATQYVREVLLEAVFS